MIFEIDCAFAYKRIKSTDNRIELFVEEKRGEKRKLQIELCCSMFLLEHSILYTCDISFHIHIYASRFIASTIFPLIQFANFFLSLASILHKKFPSFGRHNQMTFVKNCALTQALFILTLVSHTTRDRVKRFSVEFGIKECRIFWFISIILFHVFASVAWRYTFD